MIIHFDEEAYLEVNLDVKEALERGEFPNLETYLKQFGLRRIEHGKTKFHKDFEPYDKELYLEEFPEAQTLVNKGEYTSVFEHFCKVGYSEFLKYLSQKDAILNIEKEKEKCIKGFDEKSYLEVNLDVREAIENGEFPDVNTYLEQFGLRRIEHGKTKFHKDLEAYSEELYLEEFPEVEILVKNGEFESVFDHFCKVGYTYLILNLELNNNEIIENTLRENILNQFLTNLDYKKFYEVNDDVLNAIEDGHFIDLKEYLLAIGIQEIFLGNKIYIKDLLPFNQSSYEDSLRKLEINYKENGYISLFEHYLIEGYKYIINYKLKDIDNNQPDDVLKFDSKFYLEIYKDVKDAGIDPYEHYINSGEREGRCPNRFFDPIFYYNLNPDIRALGISAFLHFCEAGYSEGRWPKSPIINKVKNQKTHSLKPLLFVGHDGIQAGSEVVLLEVLKWFSEHTLRPIKVLLMSGGPLANQYASYAEVYVLDNFKINDENRVRNFLSEDFEFIYLNTVVTGGLINLLNEKNIPLKGKILAHIHEMEKVLEQFSIEMSFLLKKVELWISASPSTTETLIQKYKIKQEMVVTVPAFINPVAVNQSKNILKKEMRKELEIPDNKIVITGCGTVYWRKGPDIFVSVAKSLIKKYPNKLEFIWIGEGEDKQELINTLNKEEQKSIRFIGNKTNANQLLAVGDIFFLSAREDPFPLVVLESAQHNIPTVCFAPTTGITAFIEEDAGIAIERVDIEEAIQAIDTLIVDEEYRYILGQTARERLFSTYTTEKQNIKIYQTIVDHFNYKPSVSIIVPFYNHEKYIEERIDSILAQKIKDFEVLLLDDCSLDNSIEKIQKYLDDDRITFFENKVNSGSPFKQWQKGIKFAKADIVWIAEGDDFCDNNFLDTLIPLFNDQMVNIAAAKTEVTNEKGEVQKDALSPYLNSAFEGKFDQSYIKDGFVEVNEQFGAMCTLVNASGLLIRKSSFGNTLKKASTFKMVGDWMIYLDCLKDGKIAYSIDTKNYFRRHSNSAVHKIEGTETYFKEREAILEYVFKNYPVSKRLARRAFEAIAFEWERFSYKHPGKQLSEIFDKEGLLSLLSSKSLQQKQGHAALYVHGMMFSKGGIERLAADLSNHLVKNGWKVTIYCRSWGNLEQGIYPLFNSVNVIPIFNEHQQEASIKALKKHLLKSDIDVFVPMLSEWLFEPIIAAAKGTGIPIIASEHNDPWKIEELWWDHEKRIACFESVDKVHLLLNKFKESLPKEMLSKTVVIPNGVNGKKSFSLKNREKIILGVGRLAEQKRFDRLIDAVSLIQDELRKEEWKVEIYGDGHLKDALQNQIDELKISDLIKLCGATDNINKVYSKVSTYVMTSEFEGFGIALIEAMSFGLPCIGFKECNGPNEIIRDKKEGYLVKDVNDLANKLLKIVTSKEKVYTQMSKSALKRSKKYSMENFYKKWIILLENTIKETKVK